MPHVKMIRKTEQCPSCGRFLAVEDAYYVKDDDNYYVIGYCSEQCAARLEPSLQSGGASQ